MRGYNGICGYYYTRGRGMSTTRYVYWEQDGQKIGNVVLGNVLSQQQLIEIANSTVNETPIVSIH